MKERKAVILEPDLEIEAGELSVSQRRELARKLERWAHQLRVSAEVLWRRQNPVKKRLSLKPVCRRKLVLN
jgi:hypothetical protein